MQRPQSASWLSGSAGSALRRSASARPRSAAPRAAVKPVSAVDEQDKHGNRRRSLVGTFRALQPATGDLRFALVGDSDRVDARDAKVHSPTKGLSQMTERANQATRPMLRALDRASRPPRARVGRDAADEAKRRAREDLEFMEDALRNRFKGGRAALHAGGGGGGDENRPEVDNDQPRQQREKEQQTLRMFAGAPPPTQGGRSTPAAVQDRVEAKLKYFRNNTNGVMDELVSSIERSKRVSAIRYIRRLRQRREIAWADDTAAVDREEIEIVEALGDADETQVLLQSTIPERNKRAAGRTWAEREHARRHKASLRRRRRDRAMRRWKDLQAAEELRARALAGDVRTAERRERREARERHEAMIKAWLVVLRVVPRSMVRSLQTLRARRAEDARRERAAHAIQRAYFRYRQRKAARRLGVAMRVVHVLFTAHVRRWRARRWNGAADVLSGWLGNIARETRQGASIKVLSRAAAIRRYFMRVRTLQRGWRAKRRMISAQLEVLLRAWEAAATPLTVDEVALPLLALGGAPLSGSSSGSSSSSSSSSSDDDDDDDVVVHRAHHHHHHHHHRGVVDDEVPLEVRRKLLWDDLRARKREFMARLKAHNEKLAQSRGDLRAFRCYVAATGQKRRMTGVAGTERRRMARVDAPVFRLVPKHEDMLALVQKGREYMTQLHQSWGLTQPPGGAPLLLRGGPGGGASATPVMIVRRRVRR